jgi:alpha-ketoglutarate-dependent taurine dioxygenase
VGLCGNPISHKGSDQYLWEVTPRDVQRRFPTYSENNAEAKLHTDSSYHEPPEEFLAFLVQRPATCGGGKTIVLRINRVLDRLQETSDGRRCLSILLDNDFPAITPSVYSDAGAHVNARILTRDGRVRFREDSIRMAMNLTQEFMTQDRVWALEFFAAMVNRSPDRHGVTLEKDDMIFINNYTVLHGRTAFDDKSRLLLRVRFNALASS